MRRASKTSSGNDTTLVPMNARHDASYKHLFSSPKVVQHLIEGFLPAAKGLGRLDFSTLEIDCSQSDQSRTT